MSNALTRARASSELASLVILATAHAVWPKAIHPRVARLEYVLKAPALVAVVDA